LEHDLVVFVPGILGSRLTRGGVDIWQRSQRAIRLHVAVELARNPLKRHTAFEDLKLPPGAGHDLPEAPWAVTPEEPLEGADALPGLLKTLGPPDVAGMMGGLAPGQYVPFPYDWRLSNRVTAGLLKQRVERELTRWTERYRAHYPHAEEPPKVVYVCHSMGGLVARYHLECQDGAETARALVTLGTPHRGAAKAIRFLTGHGIGPGEDQPGIQGPRAALVGALYNDVFMEVCRTFPSMAQLLPVYRAVLRQGADRPLRPLDEAQVPDLPTELVQEAFDFHEDFEEAVERNRLRRSPWPGYAVHSIGGRAHPTVHGVQVEPGGELKFPTRLDDRRHWTGDGTVPEDSAHPWWALTELSYGVWNGYKHAELPGGEAVSHQLAVILRGGRGRSMLSADEIGVLAPELAVAGEPFEVLVQGTDRTVRASLHRPGHPPLPPVTLKPAGEGLLRAELTAGEGTWVLRVEAEPYVVRHEVVTVVAA
jgi:hypothetical protein